MKFQFSDHALEQIEQRRLERTMIGVPLDASKRVENPHQIDYAAGAA